MNTFVLSQHWPIREELVEMDSGTKKETTLTAVVFRLFRYKIIILVFLILYANLSSTYSYFYLLFATKKKRNLFAIEILILVILQFQE